MRMVAVVVAAALSAGCGAQAAGLPFYSDRSFTPSWSPVTHSVVSHTWSDTPFLDQDGAPFTPESLHGRVHVASFVFTTCASICPPLVTSLKRVQSALEGTGALVVSYSVAPEVDTVDVLARFGRTRGIHASRWKLLTGTIDGVQRVARDLYFADDDGMREAVVSGAWLHTEKVLLVDADGRIRGVYNGTQAFEIDKLIADVRALGAAGS